MLTFGRLFALHFENLGAFTTTARMESNFIDSVLSYWRDVLHMARQWVTELLPNVLKVYLAFGIVVIALLLLVGFCAIVGLLTLSALGLIDPNQEKKKGKSSPKDRQNNSSPSAAKETKPRLKTGRDCPKQPQAVEPLQEVKRLEVEIQALEEVLHARREQLALARERSSQEIPHANL